MAKKITQATFDAAVQENVDEFAMSHEEALADAISQFESQGRSCFLSMERGPLNCNFY